MAELDSDLAQERPYRELAGGLRGDKLGVVSTEEERKWPLAAGVLLVIALGAAGLVLLSFLPDLLNDLFGLALDLLLGPEP